MVKTVNELTNIKLTESDSDGIWLHFESKRLKAGISIATLLSHGDIANRTFQAWAREQLDKQDMAHRRFYLDPTEPKPPQDPEPEPLPPAPSNEFLKEGNEERTSVPGTRPSPPVEGGY